MPTEREDTAARCAPRSALDSVSRGGGPAAAAAPRQPTAGPGPPGHARMGMLDVQHLEQRGPLDLQRPSLHAEQARALAKPARHARGRWARAAAAAALAATALAMLPVRTPELAQPQPLPQVRAERGTAAADERATCRAAAGRAQPWWRGNQHHGTLPKLRGHGASGCRSGRAAHHSRRQLDGNLGR